jgi:hypothetical protein
MRLIRSALLVAALLLAQAATATHLDLDDSHAGGDSCALCAGQSVQGAGNVGAVSPILAVAGAPPQFPVERSFQPVFRGTCFRARGPPAVS